MNEVKLQKFLELVSAYNATVAIKKIEDKNFLVVASPGTGVATAVKIDEDSFYKIETVLGFCDKVK